MTEGAQGLKPRVLPRARERCAGRQYADMKTYNKSTGYFGCGGTLYF